MKNVVIDFTKIGGYRLKQATLKKMQESYITYLKSLVAFLGCEETGSYIIQGCTISDANITSGVMYIDGELCPFEETTGDLNTLIAKQATVTSLSFKNGVDEPVFREVNAVKVSSGGTKLQDFIRFHYVQDANYVHTDSNFTAAEKTKLANIEAGAQVNVIPSFAQTNPAAPNYIADKPTGKLLTYLKQGVYVHGDLMGSSQIVTIAFGDVGTSNYKVLGTLIGSGSSWGAESRVNWVAREKTATSFKLAMHDLGDVAGQNLRFEYVLVPDDNS